MGNDPMRQLYNLQDDIGEKRNLAEEYPEKADELRDLLETVRNQ